MHIYENYARQCGKRAWRRAEAKARGRAETIRRLIHDGPIDTKITAGIKVMCCKVTVNEHVVSIEMSDAGAAEDFAEWLRESQDTAYFHERYA